MCCRTISELESVGEKIRHFGRKALVHSVDISRVAEPTDMIKGVVKKYGHLDILVNNAGINIPKRAEEVTEEEWDRVHNINLRGLFFCSQAAGKGRLLQNEEQRRGLNSL